MLDSRPFLSHQLMGQEARANNVHFYTGENVQINIDINNPFLSGYLHHVISYDAKKQWV